MATKGGRQPGAGRPRGKPNRRTQKSIDKIDASGVDPLDVMLVTCKELLTLASEAEDRRERIEIMERASEVAAKIAPYKHARLSASTVKVIGVTHESVLEQLTAWEHERAAATASDASALH